MISEDIHAELTAIFRQQLRNPTLLLRPSMTHDDVPGWDSAATVAIIMAIEERYNIELSARELKEFRNVADLSAMIQKQRG